MIREHLTRSSRTTRMLVLAGALCLTVGVAGAPAHAAEAPVDLGTAGAFAVLAGESVTNTGSSVVTGDIGVSPGTSVTGLAPLTHTGVVHVADAVALQAKSDLTIAHNIAANRPTVTDVTSSNLGGQTFTTGVVEHTSGMLLTGTITLDAQNDPDAVFIFKAGSTLTTAPNSRVSLINGASPCNVYWQVGSSATLDTNTTFVGTVMALTSATLNTGATVQGRVLASTGSVTLDDNVITRPICTASASESPSVAPTTTSPSATVSPSSSTPASPSASASASAAGPGAGGGSGGGGNSGGGGSGSGDSGGSDNGGSGSNGSGSAGSGSAGSGSAGSGSGGSEGGSGETTGGSASTPVVPTGHPETGLGGSSQPAGPAWGLLALVGGLTAAAGALSWRRTRPGRLS